MSQRVGYSTFITHAVHALGQTFEDIHTERRPFSDSYVDGPLSKNQKKLCIPNTLLFILFVVFVDLAVLASTRR
jgi:hypothetical protein